ncbi:MAG: ParA family protein, partial [Halobacterium sp.]
YPAFAPFGRIADAKSVDAATRLESRLDDLATAHDAVLVDAPPVAANQAVAAVTAADRVAAVLPPGDRGVDSLQRARGRLADVGTEFDLSVANRTSEAPPDADVAVPEREDTGVPETPAALHDSDEFAVRVAAVAESLTGIAVDVDADDDSLLDAARQKLS